MTHLITPQANSQHQIDDKIMADFDTDFISDIFIGSDELHMADNFIEDFMGELNQNTNVHQIPPDPLMEWKIQDNFPQLPEELNNAPFEEARVQSPNIAHHIDQGNNIIYDVQLIPGTFNCQQILPADSFNTGHFMTNNNENQQSFNIIQNFNQAKSNSFPDFIAANEYSMVLNEDGVTPMANTPVSQILKVETAKTENKRKARNLKEILKRDDNSTKISDMGLFNFENLNTSKKSKKSSRSINSIINESLTPSVANTITSPHNGNVFSQASANQSGGFILDKNINEKIYEIQNSSNIQLLLEPNPLENKSESEMNVIATSIEKQACELSPKSVPFKLLDHSEITPRKPKLKKKTAHNAIEKKYRSSINDKILELKIRVAGPDQKLQKSGILRKTLDYLNSIEEVNSKLCNENKVLRSALKKISLNTTDFNAINEVLRSINYLPQNNQSESIHNPIYTPPNSSFSCDSDSIFSNFDNESPSSMSSMLSSPISPSNSVNSEKHAPKTITKPKRTYTKRAKKDTMMETSRVMLCMFAMSILFFNPFNMILSSSSIHGSEQTNQFYSQQTINSRVLNSLDIYEGLHTNSSNNASPPRPPFYALYLISWLLNTILVIFCLAKVYISSEPTLQPDSRYTNSLWLNYQKACRSFQLKDYSQSAIWFKQGLKDLGQTTPKTQLELILGIVWQIIRLTLDKIYIGKLFVKFGFWLYGNQNVNVYKLSGLFYFELHKFAYLNIKSEKDFYISTTTTTESSSLYASPQVATTFYSYLMGIYYLLAAYNMNEIYSKNAQVKSRDEYNLCEMYFSIILYLKFFLSQGISNLVVMSLLKKSLFVTDVSESKDVCKLQKLKGLMKKPIFVRFLREFDVKMSLDLEGKSGVHVNRQKTLSLISYKRKLFATSGSFLYAPEGPVCNFEPEISDVKKNTKTVVTVNGIACDYIQSKFQEFLLFEMTSHVVNHTGLICTEKILSGSNNSALSLMNQGVQELGDEDDDELEEIAEVDRVRFELLMTLYEENLKYFLYSRMKFSSEVIQETQLTLIQFLRMANSWKLRLFDLDIPIDQLKNSRKSDFIESVINVLRAYKCIQSDPKAALEHCDEALVSLRKFNEIVCSGRSSGNKLIQKFEILINDWLLSAQTYVWTNNKLKNMALFNQTLKNFQNLILDFPELNCKAKMYETVFMYASNRNPINLLSPTAKQTVISNCNQEAFFSMNQILKNFRLQITE